MALENKFNEVAENPFYTLGWKKFLQEKKLMASKCSECGRIQLPPRPICPNCHTFNQNLIELKGKGKLIAFTVIRVGSPLMEKEGYNKDNPYCSGIVQLEEGPCITARILGFDPFQPEKINIGSPVEVDYVQANHDGEEMTFLAFRAINNGQGNNGNGGKKSQ